MIGNWAEKLLAEAFKRAADRAVEVGLQGSDLANGRLVVRSTNRTGQRVTLVYEVPGVDLNCLT